MLNRIERGATVQTQDGDLGSVYQVIVDPDSKELTHIVVASSVGSDRLMIPADMIGEATGDRVTLNVNSSSLDSMRGSLLYNEADFQPVDPDSVEQPQSSAAGDRAIVDAEPDRVEFGSTESMGSSGSTVSTTGFSETARLDDTREGNTGSYSEGVTITPASTSSSAASISGERSEYDRDTDTTYDRDVDTTSHTSQTGPSAGGQQRKGKDLVGMPVMSYGDGERVGKVEDILFDPEQNRVIALLVDEGGWFSSAKVVPWQDIRTIGQEAILIPDKSVVINADRDDYIKRVLEADNVLLGTQVYTEDGRDLGKIGDMYLDEGSGEVVGYEVSGGMFASTLKGKKFMPAPDTLTVGKDVAFVPSSVGDAMEQQTGGLAGAAQDFGSTASERLSQAGSVTSDALSTARDRVSTLTREQQRSFALGKTATSDITSDSGEVLVPAGKIVDESDLDRAEGSGKLNAVFMAVGGAAAGGLFDTVKERATQLGEQASGTLAQRRSQQLNQIMGKPVPRDIVSDDGTLIAPQGTVVDAATLERARAFGKENQLLAAFGTASVASGAQDTLSQAQQGLTQAKEGASSMFDTVRSKFEELTGQTEEARQAREAKRIKDALGRPVTRVILDRDDSVILDTAQIVTNQAVERARAAGVLDILLDSVYEVDPDLSPDALHSGRSGEAAIDSQFESNRKPNDPVN
jgi:uncharacterized protein YrrD